LIEELGRDDFLRVRLGIRGVDRDAGELADYVLSEFGAAELPVADRLTVLGGEAVESLLREGLRATMNRYNAARSLSE
jgi:peptidyl-tRNA hydrolase